ncbi:CACNA1G [Symbiodinium sp. CCMP2592]|nr:CACNA1G [Symbiodinium sp. CCMP2592]
MAFDSSRGDEALQLPAAQFRELRSYLELEFAKQHDLLNVTRAAEKGPWGGIGMFGREFDARRIYGRKGPPASWVLIPFAEELIHRGSLAVGPLPSEAEKGPQEFRGRALGFLNLLRAPREFLHRPSSFVLQE